MVADEPEAISKMGVFNFNLRISWNTQLALPLLKFELWRKCTKWNLSQYFFSKMQGVDGMMKVGMGVKSFVAV